MRMYVSGIEDENPDWYDLVTNDGDEERVREVAEAAAEAETEMPSGGKAEIFMPSPKKQEKEKRPWSQEKRKEKYEATRKE